MFFPILKNILLLTSSGWMIPPVSTPKSSVEYAFIYDFKRILAISNGE